LQTHRQSANLVIFTRRSNDAASQNLASALQSPTALPRRRRAQVSFHVKRFGSARQIMRLLQYAENTL
jgi:hypothetical protein